MALTQTAEYALRAVVWLAHHPGDPQTTRQIADATQVPSTYLPKVFQPLVRAGLVNGQRGLRGGYSLLKDPGELTLLEVVNQVDPIHRILACPLALSEHRGRLCPLHSLLDQLIAAEQRVLAETRVSDLIGRPGQLVPLCETLAALERARASCGANKALGALHEPRRDAEKPSGNGPVGSAPNAQHSPPPPSNPT